MPADLVTLRYVRATPTRIELEADDGRPVVLPISEAYLVRER